MLPLYLPYIVALIAGYDPAAGASQALTSEQTAPIDPQVTRAPEPQEPTGKFTTAAEVKPVLAMTKSSWVAVRYYEGQDLVYFTHLMSWRCGLWDISFGVNGAPADQSLQMEPCHDDLAQPNSLIDPATYPIWATFDGETVDSVSVTITYDDGTSETATYQRSDILIP